MKIAKRFHKRWFWDHVLPKVIIKYPARGGEAVDVRQFFVDPQSKCLQDVVAKMGRSSWKLLTFVWMYVRRKREKGDFWKFPSETLEDGEGDCEDLAILLANLIRAAGEEDWRVRLNVGSLEGIIGESHCWVTWFDGENWLVLDPSAPSSTKRELYFCWNSESCYTTLENIKKWLES